MTLKNTLVSVSNIRSFVRDTLKCECPETVFDDVRIGLPALYGTHATQQGLEILVGNKLLIAVVPLEAIENPGTDIAGILQRGRSVRDQNGLNRYRLVVVTIDDTLPNAQNAAMSELLDDRLHVHLISRHAFPFAE